VLPGRGRVPAREARVIGRALRTFLGVPVIALAVIPFGLAIALAGESERAERFLRGWCRLVLFVAGARVVARVHPLDRSRSYVFVANHTSNIDVPAIVSVSPEPLRFIAKKGAAGAAVVSGLECVPIGIAGAREVLAPKGFSLFRPGPIAVVFGAPVPVAGHKIEDRDRQVAEQRKAVEACVREAREVLERERLRTT